MASSTRRFVALLRPARFAAPRRLSLPHARLASVSRYSMCPYNLLRSVACELFNASARLATAATGSHAHSLPRLLAACLVGVLSLAGSTWLAGWSAAEADSVVLAPLFLLQITTTVPTKLALLPASTPLAASKRRSCYDDTTSLRSPTKRRHVHVVYFRRYKI
eukprot:2244847-Pleurochrysis_carterae.AAC.3